MLEHSKLESHGEALENEGRWSLKSMNGCIHAETFHGCPWFY